MIKFRVRKSFNTANDIIGHLAMLNEEDLNQEEGPVSLLQDHVPFGKEVCVALIARSTDHDFAVGFVVMADEASTVIATANWATLDNLTNVDEVEGIARDAALASVFEFKNDKRIHLYQFPDRITNEVDENLAGDWIWRMLMEFEQKEIPVQFRSEA